MEHSMRLWSKISLTRVNKQTTNVPVVGAMFSALVFTLFGGVCCSG